MRGIGGMLFGIGSFVIVGAFSSKIRETATIMATLIYLCFGISRLMSALIDGVPHTNLVIVTAFEFIFGILNLGMYFKYKKQKGLQH